MEAAGDDKMGLLVYDVPEQYKLLAGKLRQRVRRFALRVNLSVYLFPWQNKELIEGTVAEVQEETGQTCSARVLPQAKEAEPQLLEMAKDAAGRMLDELYKGLRIRLDRAPEIVARRILSGKLNVNDKDKERVRRAKTILRDVKKRADEIARMGLFLKIEDTVKGWHQMVEDLVALEAEVIKKAEEELKAHVQAV